MDKNDFNNPENFGLDGVVNDYYTDISIEDGNSESRDDVPRSAGIGKKTLAGITAAATLFGANLDAITNADFQDIIGVKEAQAAPPRPHPSSSASKVLDLNVQEASLRYSRTTRGYLYKGLKQAGYSIKVRYDASGIGSPVDTSKYQRMHNNILTLQHGTAQIQTDLYRDLKRPGEFIAVMEKKSSGTTGSRVATRLTPIINKQTKRIMYRLWTESATTESSNNRVVYDPYQNRLVSVKKAELKLHYRLPKHSELSKFIRTMPAPRLMGTPAPSRVAKGKESLDDYVFRLRARATAFEHTYLKGLSREEFKKRYGAKRLARFQEKLRTRLGKLLESYVNQHSGRAMTYRGIVRYPTDFANAREKRAPNFIKALYDESNGYALMMSQNTAGSGRGSRWLTTHMKDGLNTYVATKFRLDKQLVKEIVAVSKGISTARQLYRNKAVVHPFSRYWKLKYGKLASALELDPKYIQVDYNTTMSIVPGTIKDIRYAKSNGTRRRKDVYRRIIPNWRLNRHVSRAASKAKRYGKAHIFINNNMNVPVRGRRHAPGYRYSRLKSGRRIEKRDERVIIPLSLLKPEYSKLFLTIEELVEGKPITITGTPSKPVTHPPKRRATIEPRRRTEHPRRRTTITPPVRRRAIPPGRRATTTPSYKDTVGDMLVERGDKRATLEHNVLELHRRKGEQLAITSTENRDGITNNDDDVVGVYRTTRKGRRLLGQIRNGTAYNPANLQSFEKQGLIMKVPTDGTAEVSKAIFKPGIGYFVHLKDGKGKAQKVSAFIANYTRPKCDLRDVQVLYKLPIQGAEEQRTKFDGLVVDRVFPADSDVKVDLGKQAGRARLTGVDLVGVGKPNDASTYVKLPPIENDMYKADFTCVVDGEPEKLLATIRLKPGKKADGRKGTQNSAPAVPRSFHGPKYFRFGASGFHKWSNEHRVEAAPGGSLDSSLKLFGYDLEAMLRTPTLDIEFDLSQAFNYGKGDNVSIESPMFGEGAAELSAGDVMSTNLRFMIGVGGDLGGLNLKLVGEYDMQLDKVQNLRFTLADRTTEDQGTMEHSHTGLIGPQARYFSPEYSTALGKFQYELIARVLAGVTGIYQTEGIGSDPNVGFALRADVAGRARLGRVSLDLAASYARSQYNPDDLDRTVDAAKVAAGLMFHINKAWATGIGYEFNYARADQDFRGFNQHRSTLMEHLLKLKLEYTHDLGGGKR